MLSFSQFSPESIQELIAFLKSLEGQSEEEATAALLAASRKMLQETIDMSDTEIDEVIRLLGAPETHPAELRRYVMAQLALMELLSIIPPKTEKIPVPVIVTWCMMAWVRCGADALPENLVEFVSTIYL